MLLLKKAFWYRYVAYLQRNTYVELLHGFSPLNCLNIRRTPFLKNISGWLLLFLWKSIQQVVTGTHLFRVKLELIFLTKKKKLGIDLGTTDYLQWSSLWQYNIRKSFRIDKAAPTWWWRDRKAASVCYYL